MVRFSGFLFILTTALIVGLVIHFGDERNEARYVGVDVCGACHATTTSALVYQDWKESPHSRAYSSLESTRAEEYLKVNQASLENCLQCHTTLGREGANEFEEKLNGDGVGCERCHGPGSEYVQTTLMKSSASMLASGGSPGNLADCYACHAENPLEEEWACPFQEAPFDAAIGWEEIGHSRTDTRVNVQKDSLSPPTE